jgi:hypothetical protein
LTAQFISYPGLIGSSILHVSNVVRVQTRRRAPDCVPQR